MRMMWLILQQSEPDDYVVASGKQQLVWDLIDRVGGRGG
jgi:GDP-D-mannose dehydratase